jgi:hypothetical protein
VILSSARSRIVEALEKRDGAKRTKFDDPTIERGLEYAYSRPFAVYATLGLRQESTKLPSAASKLNFIAAGIQFDDRGMHFYTLGDETELGKVVELQRAFGAMLSLKAKASDPPDLQIQRIADLLLNAEPSRTPFPKLRRSHLSCFVPTKQLDEWFAPFVPK